MKRGVDRLARLVFDTSTYSWLRRGHEKVLDLIAQSEVVIVPVTVLGELEAAFLSGKQTSSNRTLLQEFLAEPFVTIWPTTESVAGRYGELL